MNTVHVINNLNDIHGRGKYKLLSFWISQEGLRQPRLRELECVEFKHYLITARKYTKAGLVQACR